MSILNISGLTKYYGAELIFRDITFQVARGDKLALVGVNGAGKSTLMKIIAGVEDATSGGLNLARGRSLAYLAQEAQFSGERTLMGEMHAALEEVLKLQAEIAELEHALADTGAPDWEARMERYGELTHRFEHAGGYEIEHRIDRTLHGLGFSEEQYHQPLRQFSGGQKTRAALAAALLSDPDLLLLDEPTNHLDLAALEWLERFLKDWDGTLIVISHDRYFLDHVTNRTIEIANNRLDGDYPAAYQKYLELKAERLELQLKQYQAQQEYIAKTEDFIRRFKAGQRTKEARGREKILNRLKHGYQGANGQWIDARIDAPTQQRKLSMNLGAQARSGEMVLKLDKLVVGYAAGQGPGVRGQGSDGNGSRPPAPGPRPLIECPDLEINRGRRVALMGPNGSGKTTLLRTIVGELPPLRGQIRLGHRVVVNYYAQAHEGLQMQASVLDEIRRVKPLIKEGEARNMLARFLFTGDDVFKRVGDLSGGERSRVALAQLTLMAGNLLVLDEPTNHLDINAREALEVVLNEYDGTILFVSHDRYFIDAVADTIWMVRDGSIEAFDGTYSEYAAYREAKETKDAKDEGRRTKDEGRPEPVLSKVEPTDDRRLTKGQPAASNGKHPNGQAQADPKPFDREAERRDRKRQRRMASLEEEIAMLEEELKKLTEEMTAASMSGEGKRVKALEMQYADVQDMLHARYDEWAVAAG